MGFAVNFNLDGRALGGRTAQRRFTLPKHHIREIIWEGLMWSFEMLSDKGLGQEELGKSLDGTSSGTSNRIFRLGPRTCVQGLLGLLLPALSSTVSAPWKAKETSA